MSLFYLGKSPIEDIPTSGHVRHNQAKSSLEIPKQRALVIDKKHKSATAPQRKLASKSWKFYNMDEEPEQAEQEDSFMDSLDQSGSLSAREKKSIVQLKTERVLRQQVLFQEIEHNIREKREEDSYHPVSPIVKDRFAMSETMSHVLAKHREKFGHKQNEVEEILRERDIKMYNNIGQSVEKGENAFERKISLPRLMRRQGSGGNLSSMGYGNKRPSPTDDDDENGSRGSSDEGGDDLVPSYGSLHPLEQEMRETIDFPADLVEDEELYVEDSDYLDYKRRLDDGRDSSDEEEETKLSTRAIQEQEFLAQKRKKAQNFGQRWFLHPSQWSVDMDNKNKIKREKHDHSEKIIREKLKNLSSSKLFKMHLIKTNNAVPDWLADCNIKNQHPLLSIDYDKSSQTLIPPIIKSMHNDNIF